MTENGADALVVEGEELAFPDGWAVVPLADLCHVERGITFPGSAKTTEPSQERIPCLRTTNVQKSVRWDDLIFVPRSYVKTQDKLVRQNDVLISMANSRELVGKVSLVEHLPLSSTFGGFIAAIRAFETAILPRFLYHYL